jgi:hypothetical protein
MEFNKNEGAILASVESAAASVAEIDLYDELITFSGLSPEEQLRIFARSKKSEEKPVERPGSGSISAQNTGSSVEIQVTELQAANMSEPEDPITGVRINEVRPEASEASSLTGSPSALSSTPAQSNPNSEDTAAKAEVSDVSPQLFDRSRTGPLLAGLSVFGDFVFAGDLSRGVCLACGAESAAEDLFCVSCGVFIDEIDSTPKSSPSCGECGHSVTADEIFCPWCGAAPAA